jgi:hypothetical protein
VIKNERGWHCIGWKEERGWKKGRKEGGSHCDPTEIINNVLGPLTLSAETFKREKAREKNRRTEQPDKSTQTVIHKGGGSMGENIHILPSYYYNFYSVLYWHRCP